MPRSEIFSEGLLDGRSILVTGGGTNLGKAASEELVRCGANVVIAGRREEVLEEAAQEIRASYVVGDIRSSEDAERIVNTVVDRHGALDVLVNNAGGQYFVPAEAIETKGWNAVMNLNVGGTELMTRTAHAIAKPSAILNVTLSPHHGLAGMTHSSAARAAVEAYTEAWAQELAPTTVIALAVGHMDTLSLRKYPEPVYKAAHRSVPLQRLGRMEEHAWLVALCCSDLGHALNGSIVTLDGARDNWFGPWPPVGLVDEAGAVPTEARRPG